MKRHWPSVMKIDSDIYREYVAAMSLEAWKEETEAEYEEYLVNNDK